MNVGLVTTASEPSRHAAHSPQRIVTKVSWLSFKEAVIVQ